MSLGPIVVLAVLLLVGVDGCLHCAGWHPPSVEEEMLSADQIVYGRVTRTTFPDDRDQYRAEVQVYCVMKGQRTPVFISLTDVGQSLATPHTQTHTRPETFVQLIQTARSTYMK